MRGALRIFCVAAAGWLMAAASADADKFPSRPVTLIVPWQAGISADILLRGMAEVAAKELGQPVIVDNKPGASGTLGPAAMASSAKPDGYTVAQIVMPVFRMPHLQKVTFDPLTDFTWIIQLGGYTVGAVTAASSPFKTFSDVVTFAKANPGKLTYMTPGPSTLNSISMELIARQEGTKIVHIPSKGAGESQAALLGGHVMLAVESPAWAPLVASGELRLLALLNAQRSNKWPDVPTLTELGYNYNFASPFGLAGPKGVDPAVVKVLHDAFKKAYDDPKVIELYAKFDFARTYLDTQAFAASAPGLYEGERANLDKLGMIKKD